MGKRSYEFARTTLHPPILPFHTINRGDTFVSGNAGPLYPCHYRSRHLHARHTFCDVVLAATRRRCSELQIVVWRKKRRRPSLCQATDGLSSDFLRRSGSTFSTSASAVMPCFLRRIGTAPCSMNWSGQPMRTTGVLIICECKCSMTAQPKPLCKT